MLQRSCMMEFYLLWILYQQKKTNTVARNMSINSLFDSIIMLRFGETKIAKEKSYAAKTPC